MSQTEAEHSGPTDGYPSMAAYDGGGSILNGYTTVRNVVEECKTHGVDVFKVLGLIAIGCECIILNGEIKGVRSGEHQGRAPVNHDATAESVV